MQVIAINNLTRVIPLAKMLATVLVSGFSMSWAMGY